MRDWLFVEDHAEALVRVLEQGEPGDTYAIGARQPRTNLQVVQAICAALDARVPDPAGPRERLIRFVTDRPGHDFRYEIDPDAHRGGAGLERAARFRDRVWRGPSTGISPTAPGGRACAPRNTPASGWAPQRSAELGTAA